MYADLCMGWWKRQREGPIGINYKYYLEWSTGERAKLSSIYKVRKIYIYIYIYIELQGLMVGVFLSRHEEIK